MYKSRYSSSSKKGKEKKKCKQKSQSESLQEVVVFHKVLGFLPQILISSLPSPPTPLTQLTQSHFHFFILVLRRKIKVSAAHAQTFTLLWSFCPEDRLEPEGPRLCCSRPSDPRQKSRTLQKALRSCPAGTMNCSSADQSQSSEIILHEHKPGTAHSQVTHLQQLSPE